MSDLTHRTWAIYTAALIAVECGHVPVSTGQDSWQNEYDIRKLLTLTGKDRGLDMATSSWLSVGFLMENADVDGTTNDASGFFAVQGLLSLISVKASLRITTAITSPDLEQQYIINSRIRIHSH